MGKLSRNKGVDLQNTFKYQFALKTTLKSPIWDPIPAFPTFPSPQNVSFPPQLPFWITNIEIHIVEKAPMNYTDHLGFHPKSDFDM